MKPFLALVLIAGVGAYLDGRFPFKSTSSVPVAALKAPAEPTQEEIKEINRLMEARVAKLRARGGCMKNAKVTVGPVTITRTR